MKIRNIDDLSVAAIRSYAIDCINKANSGHPGMNLGSAAILYTLYNYFLNANPGYPEWINRDRLVMSSGHASILQYILLHLCGYKISCDDLQKFRKLNSICPGHPEIQVTPGIDVSSGPLGQGISAAVGLAIAETMLNKKYGSEVYDHYTYCLCGDGCLQEGISQEAIQYAGLMKLNKLILLYDNNDVTLDGPLSNSSIENTKLRFLSNNWNVIECKDGNNVELIKKCITKARKEKSRPIVIIFKTIIGIGSKYQGDHKVHGVPLGVEDGAYAKKSYGFDYPDFTIPKEVYENFKNNFIRRSYEECKKYVKLNSNNKNYKKALKLSSNDISSIISKVNFKYDNKDEATRISSQNSLTLFHSVLDNLVGGSADVAGSVMTKINGLNDYGVNNRDGRNLNWGIREFLMCSASNGILLHGGLRTYTGCFLVFSDYAKNAIRMSALMEIPQIFIFSHDSLAVGEDGPSHQPIEQLAALRAIPNLNVFRPCDKKETFASYKIALESTKNPSAIITTRQKLPLIDNSSTYEKVKKGAYIISPSNKKNPDCIIIATGSEVSLALKTKELLKTKKIDVRVVSMPCMELFDIQKESYKLSILGSNYNKCFSLEMSSTFGWGKYAKYNYGVNTFGKSGEAKEIFKEFKFSEKDFASFVIKNLKK